MKMRHTVAALAAALVVVAQPAFADGEYDETNTQQPPTTVRVLPERCTGEVNVMPATPSECDVTHFGRHAPIVVVWGDSHAWQQLPAMKADARRSRTNLVVFTMGACPPVSLRGGGPCAKNGRLALSYVREQQAAGRDVRVVLGSFWHLYADLHARAANGWVPESATTPSC